MSRHSSSPPIDTGQLDSPDGQVLRDFFQFVANHPDVDEQRKVRQAWVLAMRWAYDVKVDVLLRRLADDPVLRAQPLDLNLVDQALASGPLTLERLLREIYLVDLVQRQLDLLGLPMDCTAAKGGGVAALGLDETPAPVYRL
jgi:hypothetical protein